MSFRKKLQGIVATFVVTNLLWIAYYQQGLGLVQGRTAAVGDDAYHNQQSVVLEAVMPSNRAVGDSNVDTTSNLDKDDVAAIGLIHTADIHTADTADPNRMSSTNGGAWVSGGATSTTTHTAGTNAQCLSLNFEEEIDAIISKSTQVFVTMPAKAAGTSLEEFTEKCMKQKAIGDNVINSPDLSEKFLTNSFELPAIITSHLYTEDPLVDLAKHSTRQTLIIHMHRDETERLSSGIAHVLMRTCLKQRPQDVEIFKIARNETHCIIDERPVVNYIKNRVNEIGWGSPEILSCRAYEAIEQNAPKMIVVHYKQASKLQKLLAKHHCPELMEQPPAELNRAKDKDLKIYLRLQNQGGAVENLNQWFI